MKRYIAAAVAAMTLALASQAAAAAPDKPRLIVLISIDQFRADYLTRFQDLYLAPGTFVKPGGFRFLIERGAHHADAHHDHYPLTTGPGHSVLMTGSPPYKTGIVANDWYDRAAARQWYCVEDPMSPLVGAPPATTPRTGISPRTLRVSSVGDELKLAAGEQAKVWSVSIKDRASVLMAGAMANGALWFDDTSGTWISSHFYFPNGALPSWLTDLNAKKPLDRYFGYEWNLSVRDSATERVYSKGNKHAGNPHNLGLTFPKKITGGIQEPGAAFYRAFATTPLANDFVIETARELIRAEALGQDAVPDVLAINLSTNDYIGHSFGPNSLEVLDTSVRTDQALAGFFRHLAKTVPGGLGSVTIVLTADHGVAPPLGESQDAKLRSGGFTLQALETAAQEALTKELGAGKWITKLMGQSIYLNLELLGERKISPARAEEIAARAVAAVTGIHSAYTRSQITEGRVPNTDIGRRIVRSFHPKLSGDVVVVSESHWTPTSSLKGATHAAPYSYDTKVPLLMAGFGVRAGTYRQRVSTLDIAPTLADILGINPPSGSEGAIMGHARK